METEGDTQVIEMNWNYFRQDTWHLARVTMEQSFLTLFYKQTGGSKQREGEEDTGAPNGLFQKVKRSKDDVGREITQTLGNSLVLKKGPESGMASVLSGNVLKIEV